MLPQSNRNRKLERRETGCQHIRSRTEEQTGNSLRHTCRRFPPSSPGSNRSLLKTKMDQNPTIVGPIHGRRRSPANPEPTNPPGLAPREAMQKYDQPVYINRRYADILIPAGENPVGQLVSRYDKSFQNVLAGGSKTGMYNLRDCQRPLYQYAGRRSDAFLDLSQ